MRSQALIRKHQDMCEIVGIYEKEYDVLMAMHSDSGDST